MTYVEKAQIMDEQAVARAVARISHEIIERNQGTENLVLVGIRRRGVPLARMIQQKLKQYEGADVPLGVLDITLYRDDLQQIGPTPVVRTSELPEDITGKIVVLVDRGHRELPIRADFVGKNLPTSEKEVVRVSVKDEDGFDSVSIGEVVSN